MIHTSISGKIGNTALAQSVNPGRNGSAMRRLTLKSLMSGWTAQRMKMGQTVREPVAVVGTILVHQSPSEKLTEGTVQQR